MIRTSGKDLFISLASCTTTAKRPWSSTFKHLNNRKCQTLEHFKGTTASLTNLIPKKILDDHPLNINYSFLTFSCCFTASKINLFRKLVHPSRLLLLVCRTLALQQHKQVGWKAVNQSPYFPKWFFLMYQQLVLLIQLCLASLRRRERKKKNRNRVKVCVQDT